MQEYIGDVSSEVEAAMAEPVCLVDFANRLLMDQTFFALRAPSEHCYDRLQCLRNILDKVERTVRLLRAMIERDSSTAGYLRSQTDPVPKEFTDALTAACEAFSPDDDELNNV